MTCNRAQHASLVEVIDKVAWLVEELSTVNYQLSNRIFSTLIPSGVRTINCLNNKYIKNMATITLERSLLNEMSHIMGNENLMAQTIKFVRSIRRKAKAEKAEFEYVPNAETRAAIEECESGKELETLDIANFKAYVKSL